MATLALVMSGCSGANGDLEGKNTVTFEVNGGILNYGTSSTNTKVNFAYHPGTYILDPTTFPNYSISRSGYNFTGWYTSAECKPDQKWDFSTLFERESLTLYAGWEKAIKFSYSLYYKDTDGEVLLGSYTVSSGDKFEDWRNFASNRKNYTGIGYYSDPDCTIPWDYTTTHPGGDADLDVKVYVKYIEGDWELVDSFAKLKAAIKEGNVYLTSDIDCGGEELSISSFGKIFEGNGYKISNFKVNKGGTMIRPSIAIFNSLTATADIRNVTFDNVTYNFFDIRESTETITVKVQASSLAVNMAAGAKVSNVTINGTFSTDYNGTLNALSNAFYYEGEPDAKVLEGVKNFTANITVDKQS